VDFKKILDDLYKFAKKIGYGKQKEYFYGKVPNNKIPPGLKQETILANTHYVTIWLRRYYLKNIRKGIKKFHGTVHSDIVMGHRGSKEGIAQFPKVTTPEGEVAKDAGTYVNFLENSEELLHQVPYIGDPMYVECGLFSMEAGDVTTPFLNLVKNISDTAGISFVSTALPYVDLIKDGISLLYGAQQGDQPILELGFQDAFGGSDMKPLETGVILVVKNDKFDIKDYRLSSEFFLVKEQNGIDGNKYTDTQYFVLSIECSQEKKNWHSIAILQDAYLTIVDELVAGNFDKINKELFPHFRALAITCPDILGGDAKKIISQVRKIIDDVSKDAKAAEKLIPKWEQISIY